VLITGEPGVGKTLLADTLIAELDFPERWARVDAAPGLDPLGFMVTLGRCLGLAAADRIELAEALAEHTNDGRRWGLVLDEAQLASLELLEEFRLLSNRWGRPEGFEVMLLIGQTVLAQRLHLHALAPLEARLAAHIRLRPLDRDEARELLRQTGHPVPPALVDHLHRAALGNPGRLLRLLAVSRDETGRTLPAATAAPSVPASTDPDQARSQPAPVLAADTNTNTNTGKAELGLLSRLGETRPPLHVEENLIEVGWQPEPDETPPPATLGPESIEDHYAALQAWNEWARNQGRLAAEPTRPESAPPRPLTDAAAGAAAASVWLDPQQPFAPYSQLFSRSRQPRDADS
jgi:general secretion pathway protein A